MLTIEEVLAAVHGLTRAELDRFLANRWVVPERSGGTLVFAEIDVARIELIRGLRLDFDADEETTAVVLSLLDRVYALRHRLRLLCEAVEAQGEPVRRAIAEEIGRRRRP
jgi:hypothetical protein